MSYKDGLTAAKTVSRKTGADGDWFTSEIIAVQDANLRYLANAIDEAGLTDLSDIAEKAKLGAIAYDMIVENDLPGLSAKAEDSQKLANAVDLWLSAFSGMESSAACGKSAYDAIKSINITALQTSAENGNSAWNVISAIDVDSIMVSAKYGAAASATIAAMPKLGSVTEELLQQMMNEAGSAYSAYNVLTANRDLYQWDTQFAAVNASANLWNLLYTDVSKSGAAWNELLSVLTSANLWDSCDWRKMNNMANIVSANSASWKNVQTSADALIAMSDAANVDVWNAMATACESEKWNAATTAISNGSAKWNMIGDPTNWNSVYETVYSKSGRWDMIANDVANWNAMRTAINASANKWNSAANVATNSTKWNAASTLTTDSSANWNLTYTSANNYKDMYDTVASAIPNFNKLYNQIDASANNWNKCILYAVKNMIPIQQAYETVSANSADWNTMKNTVDDGEENWDKVYAYVSSYADTISDTTVCVAENSNFWLSHRFPVRTIFWEESFDFWTKYAPSGCILKTNTTKSATIVQTSAFNMNDYKSNLDRIIFIEV